MGAADTVPGVSGGTVALILGHYTRLVTAISRVDSTLLGLIRGGRWRHAARYLDVRFLAALLVGVLTGVVTLAGVMHHALEHYRPMTMAVFLGLMAASVWVVKDNVGRWSGSRWVALVVGGAVAVGVSRLPTGAVDPSPGYVFVAASVAICAMILPGISGAFVLLLFGVYKSVTGTIKEVARGNVDAAAAVRLVAFGGGCLFGLLAFTKLLKWLLANHRDVTMATLVGLMVGSVAKLWPLQRVIVDGQGVELVRMYGVGEWEGAVWPLIGAAVAAGLAVWFIERTFAGEPVEEGRV